MQLDAFTFDVRCRACCNETMRSLQWMTLNVVDRRLRRLNQCDQNAIDVIDAI